MKPLRRIRRLIHLVLLRPIMGFIGMTVHNREGLDINGPAIVVANHNSHVDTAALLAAFPNRIIPSVRPAAAADYFLRNRPLAWLATRIVGIAPVNRSGGAQAALRWCGEALRRGEIVLLFPEGTRGAPGQPNRFRRGVAVLAAEHPDVPIIPVHIAGAGDVLPRGSWLPLPLGVELSVGEPIDIPRGVTATTLTGRIEEAVWSLAA
jgi:1-acyl-sn-glycerol-3-phosphate acyltransferase